MNAVKFIATGFIFILVLVTGALKADTEYTFDLSSRYIWRGFDLNPDNKPVLQPGITRAFGKNGFSLNLWGSFSFEDRELNEIDISLSYDVNLSENISMSAGLTHYGWYFTRGFRFSRDTSHEIYLSATHSGNLMDTSFSVCFDFDKGDGFYFLLEGAKSFRLSDKTGLDLSASLGYNAGQWIDGSGFSDIVMSAALPTVLDAVTVSPFLNMAFILMDEVNPSNSEIWFGVSVSF